MAARRKSMLGTGHEELRQHVHIMARQKSMLEGQDGAPLGPSAAWTAANKRDHLITLRTPAPSSSPHPEYRSLRLSVCVADIVVCRRVHESQVVGLSSRTVTDSLTPSLKVTREMLCAEGSAVDGWFEPITER